MEGIDPIHGVGAVTPPAIDGENAAHEFRLARPTRASWIQDEPHSLPFVRCTTPVSGRRAAAKQSTTLRLAGVWAPAE
jgi:hypothetical protein